MQAVSTMQRESVGNYVEANIKTYITIFFIPAEHDNALHLLFPHHPPEVINSVWEGSLSGYVGSFLSVTLHVETRSLRRERNV